MKKKVLTYSFMGSIHLEQTFWFLGAHVQLKEVGLYEDHQLK